MPPIAAAYTRDFAGQERRRTRRYRILDHYLIGIELGSGNGGIVLDLAERGLSIQAVVALHAGSSCRLWFQLPSAVDRVSTIGEVVWVRDNKTAGILFKDMPLSSLQLLRRWLQLNEGSRGSRQKLVRMPSSAKPKAEPTAMAGPAVLRPLPRPEWDDRPSSPAEEDAFPSSQNGLLVERTEKKAGWRLDLYAFAAAVVVSVCLVLAFTARLRTLPAPAAKQHDRAPVAPSAAPAERNLPAEPVQDAKSRPQEVIARRQHPAPAASSSAASPRRRAAQPGSDEEPEVIVRHFSPHPTAPAPDPPPAQRQD